jgi:hypothetical protein
VTTWWRALPGCGCRFGLFQLLQQRGQHPNLLWLKPEDFYDGNPGAGRFILTTKSVSYDKAILVGKGTLRRYCPSPAAQPQSIWPVSVARRPAKILTCWDRCQS